MENPSHPIHPGFYLLIALILLAIVGILIWRRSWLNKTETQKTVSNMDNFLSIVNSLVSIFGTLVLAAVVIYGWRDFFFPSRKGYIDIKIEKKLGREESRQLDTLRMMRAGVDVKLNAYQQQILPVLKLKLDSLESKRLSPDALYPADYSKIKIQVILGDVSKVLTPDSTGKVHTELTFRKDVRNVIIQAIDETGQLAPRLIEESLTDTDTLAPRTIQLKPSEKM